MQMFTVKFKGFFKILTLCMLFLNSYAQLPGKTINRYKADLGVAREKVYLHTDKPYYFKGDSIWFKAYVVTGAGNQLSKISGAIYVDLIDIKGVVLDLKLPVINGLAKGCFALGKTAPGNYRLRAYTRWMRNTGENSYFDRSFIIGDPLQRELSVAVLSAERTGNVFESALSYSIEGNKPLVNTGVTYLVRSDWEEIKTGISTTNETGNLKIAYKLPAKTKTDFVKIESRLASDTSLVNNIILDTWPNDEGIQFLPEGGTLVEGLRCRVGIKSIGRDGLGKDIQGTITDEAGNQVTDFKTDHLGMGRFSFTPQSGKHYKAIINRPGLNALIIYLPKAQVIGAILSAYHTNTDSIQIRVLASPAIYSKGAGYKIRVTAGDQVLFQGQIYLDKPINAVVLPGKNLSCGVLQITLFSEENIPVAERLIFNNGNSKLKLTLTTDKSIYLPRDKTKIQISAKDHAGLPVIGNFSVSVVNESIVPISDNVEHSILTDLLLCSDLKGFVEEPGYYFTDINEQKKNDLDLLMLTQGYRHFKTKENTFGKIPLSIYQTESLSTTFSGLVHTLSGKAVANARVTMFSINAKVLEQTNSDSSGRFSFPGFLLTDSVKLSFKAVGSNGKRVEIELDTLSAMPRNIADGARYWSHEKATMKIIQQAENAKSAQQKKYKIGSPIELREVDIKGTKKRDGLVTENLNGTGNADYVLRSTDLGSCPTLRICLERLVPGLIFSNVNTRFSGPVSAPFFSRNLNHGSPASLYWNGLRVDLENYPDYLEQNIESPQDIAAIEVLKNINYSNLYGAQDAGVILVTTKRGYDPSSRRVAGYALLNPKGFNKIKEFYVPKYFHNKLADEPDYRNTVYWNPSITTDNNGEALFSFFNNDAKGTYRIVIEGITGSGGLGRLVFRYQVK